MNLYEEYSQVMDAISALSQKRDSIKERILSEMNEQGSRRKSNEYGTFTVSTKTAWEYSEQVKKLDDVIKIKQIQEQKNGKAKRVETTYLTFRKPE